MSGLNSFSGHSTQVGNARFDGGRDKYGRSAQQAYTADRLVCLGMIVRMPKAVVAREPERTYLSNDWTEPERDQAVQYHRTLKQARERMAAVADTDRVQHRQQQIRERAEARRSVLAQAGLL